MAPLVNKSLLSFLMVLGCFFYGINVSAQVSVNEVPLIGAEVFIEPGQNENDVDTWFKRMKECGMTITRIRMFESYMHKPDGSWDYSLFDRAFKAGEKYNIKIYANLFPATDFDDVGGFKFPRSEAHLKSISNYIKNLAGHFKQFKSLYGWVPINEPGCGHYPKQEFTNLKLAEWKKLQPVAAFNKNSYVHFDFADERFLVDYNTWFLKWLTDEIHRYDNGRPVHVNNHAIFKNAAEYDFPKWRTFLTSLGGSAHASWHFDYFKRSQYAMALSANSEILRSGAGSIPWLMTELQGGNNTFSGNQAMCPTSQEISQWIWTTLATGSKGAIFWCLNPRMSGIEAGEWALLNFQNQPSDRMLAIGQITSTIGAHAQLFANAQVQESGINILYVRQSMWVEKKQSLDFANDFEARKPGAVMKSALAYFEALSQLGLQANMKEIAEFDFGSDDYTGKTIILSNQIAIPTAYYSKLKSFVQKGGKLIADGSTAYYNENAICVMNNKFPLKDLFGGVIKEYKMRDTLYNVKLNGYTQDFKAHAWQGYIEPATGQSLGKVGNEVIALENTYGKGKTLWIPSLLGLGSRLQNDYNNLGNLLCNEVNLKDVAFRFPNLEKDMMMKTLKSGNSYLTVIINKSGQKKELTLAGSKSEYKSQLLYTNSGGAVNGKVVSILPEETLVIKWDKN
ncbi:beta-galactosidase trimerization domain-containing protein [Mucilaginibacter sp. PAMB04274]|uniref:beta-galactosidase n=1 Tax=Mucilaginibacter sp. PAMB04274 TaxID=3138568 RepID=UPI0031F68AD8